MTEMILDFMGAYGYLAVFLLMVLENIFPPIPSEVILPYVGHLAATGELNPIVALLVAVAGSFAGTSFWFLIGWIVSVDRLKIFFAKYGGYIAITLKDFERAARFFKKHERAAVFFGRMVPAVRSVISIPAGSVRMPPRLFILISLAGILIWNTALIVAGYFLLSDVRLVESYVNPIADLVLLAFVGAYVVQVIRFFLHRRATQGEA
jgi:membrane protein DedA with SNARE-associated domain